MFEFVWWQLLFILPLPFLIAYFWPAKAQESQAALYFPHVQLLSKQAENKQKRSLWRLFLLSLIWISLVISAARPMWFGEPISIPSEGRDLMMAVDLSGSMQQTDMQVNGKLVDRLEMVKSVMDDFVERRVGDRLGLILFADTAYLQTPLTFDRATVNQLLKESVIGLVGDSTAIGDAIGLAVKRFTQKERSNRVLILLTDGRNTAGNISVEQALDLAIANEVTIYSIGVGADELIQNSVFGRRAINPSLDLDERTLVTISKETGGEYFRARNAQELSQIYAILDKLEPIEGAEQTLRPRKELFYIPLMFSGGLVFIWVLLPILRTVFMRLTGSNRNTSAKSSDNEQAQGGI
ncbi:vWA domain-containing protein [Glaciecola petra]|uniref:VWA domain-containing protein n=1 Tax=Glaciecola petra TaxID=3075602 RepID=A0ABU2ZQ20_9ALTE|nr:VWA domain-containing protein [Aestuariibacter sp. P117]MDT0594719.1 VWA domain-containing protein [Aestuariibacter sp. P117]